MYKNLLKHIFISLIVFSFLFKPFFAIASGPYDGIRNGPNGKGIEFDEDSNICSTGEKQPAGTFGTLNEYNPVYTTRDNSFNMGNSHCKGYSIYFGTTAVALQYAKDLSCIPNTITGQIGRAHV